MPISTAIPTETKPTASEMREPESGRESTSRPSWSVPSQCFVDGPSRIVFMSVLFGSHGASAGASTAIATRIPTTTAPQQASWLRENVRQNWRISPRRARAAGRILAPPPPRREADARVHEPVGEVGEQVGQERQRRDDDEIAH